MTITFYDITSTLPGSVWAPNPLKARFAFYYKGIPFQTEFVEFKDVQATVKGLGAPPSSVAVDGTGKYTVPTIIDQSTGKTITDSIVIAEYLDDTFPDKPTLFPPGTKAAIHMFNTVWDTQFVLPVLMPLLAPVIPRCLSPASQSYVLELQERYKGIVEVVPDEKRLEQIEKIKVALTRYATVFDKNGKDKPFFFGDNFSYADCICAGWLCFAKRILDSSEWEIIAGFDGGRWARLVTYCEQLEESK